MNETEKKAFEILGEKAKEKIAGGVREDEALTDKQCSELREAVSELSEDDQLQIAGGKKGKAIPINKKPIVPDAFVMYGGPGYFDPDRKRRRPILPISETRDKDE